MKHTYILHFKNSKISNAELLFDLDRELKTFEIINELNVRETKKIKALYQGKLFEITFEIFENFPETICIRTEEKYNLEDRKEILKLLWRLMHWNYKVDYSQMEILKKDSFDLINERFENRFINPSKIHALLKTKIDPIEFEFSEVKDDDYDLIKASISLDKVNSLEEAWINFCLKLDYDQWDTINNEFVPIRLEEYKSDFNEFLNHWQIPENSTKLNNENSIRGILKVRESWDVLELLILRENTIDYLGVFICVG
ncbi:hypothetical protein [Aureivirga sp. CE67]|uniref:hypothetical protein n=1 Tax=Aureivirga sp. CE67 TaxID=1788983 RepID=UPI0018CA19AE|nr:hypothetical protein [Aureivirga sp. CE67]